MTQPIERQLRDLAPKVLGSLARRYGGHFDLCEDAVQEALLAAAIQWPDEGVPEHPRGWLSTVAARRLMDLLRSEQSRRAREETAAAMEPVAPASRTATGEDPEEDDSLTLMFLCCHPALSQASQVALTLRAVGGLSTAEIANAFLVPEPTMAQRISRAKQQIRRSGIEFAPPPPGDLRVRLDVVCQVLYLIFNEGYTASSGPDLQRLELTREAIRLARELHRILPDDGEVSGLLALMLLTDARRRARTGPDGSLIPLADQDRSLWNRDAIDEGTGLIEWALSHTGVGRFRLQAAIAAVHAGADNAQDTDWKQIVALYSLLERISPSPVITLNHAVAAAMVDGPYAGLELVASLDRELGATHRLEAVRAHLLEMAGELERAKAAYLAAARRTTSVPERRYLEGRADRLLAS